MPRSDVPLAVALAWVAGCVDAYGFITVQTYVSFMSGNTTQGGYGLGQWQLAVAAPALLAIALFVAGVFAGTLLATSRRLATPRVRLGLAAALLALVFAATRAGLAAGAPDIALLAFAMGVMNTCLSQVGREAVSLTFVTGTLNRVATHLALALRRAPLAGARDGRDTHLRRAAALAAVWAGFFTGAICSGFATPHAGAWVLAAPLALLVGASGLSRQKEAMSDER